MMRRFILIISLSLGVVFSQSFELSTFGGVGFSNIWGKRFPLDTTNLMVAYNAGISGQYNIDEINTIRMEVGYYNKGYSANGNRSAFHYIVVSPMMQFHVSAKVKFYFLVGPYFGFMANKKQEHEVFDMGMHLGIGYKQNVFRQKIFLFIELKDQFGLLNIATKGNGHLQNHCLNGSLGASYKF